MNHKQLVAIRERTEKFATLYKTGKATSEDLTRRALEAHNDVMLLLMGYPEVQNVHTSAEVAKLMGKPDDADE